MQISKNNTSDVIDASSQLDISIVLPCLNESETLASCIDEIEAALKSSGLRGEIIVSDNGSDDDSVAIAFERGAKVVHASPRGYGVALSTGIASAAADIVVMGDADQSYDFGDIPRFLKKAEEGFDIVIGNRFLGGVMPGAMPWSHRWIGNPALTMIGRVLFRCPIGDFHCGLRAIRKDAFQNLRLERPGMEFASEMIVRAKLAGLRMAEIPTTLRPDGRSRPPHLRSFADGWRHLRFMLFFCPLWLFLIPGTLLASLGVALQIILMSSGGVEFRGIHFGINTSLVSAMLIILGLQLIGSGLLVRTIGQSAGMLPQAPSNSGVLNDMPKYGLLIGCVLAGIGITLFFTAVNQWRETAFGDLSSALTICRVIPAVTLVTTGTQVAFYAMLGSVIQFLASEPCPSHRCSSR